MFPIIGWLPYNGIPYLRVPSTIKELIEIVQDVPDEESGWLVEGWRGRKQTLKRQIEYYNELEDELDKKDEYLNELQENLRYKAKDELDNLEYQETLDNYWWQEKIEKIAKATGLQAP